MRIGLAKKDSYRGTPLLPVQHMHDISITQLNKTKDIIFTEDVRTMSFIGDHFKRQNSQMAHNITLSAKPSLSKGEMHKAHMNYYQWKETNEKSHNSYEVAFVVR